MPGGDTAPVPEKSSSSSSNDFNLLQFCKELVPEEYRTPAYISAGVFATTLAAYTVYAKLLKRRRRSPEEWDQYGSEIEQAHRELENRDRNITEDDTKRYGELIESLKRREWKDMPLRVRGIAATFLMKYHAAVEMADDLSEEKNQEVLNVVKAIFKALIKDITSEERQSEYYVHVLILRLELVEKMDSWHDKVSAYSALQSAMEDNVNTVGIELEIALKNLYVAACQLGYWEDVGQLGIKLHEIEALDSFMEVAAEFQSFDFGTFVAVASHFTHLRKQPRFPFKKLVFKDYDILSYRTELKSLEASSADLEDGLQNSIDSDVTSMGVKGQDSIRVMGATAEFRLGAHAGLTGTPFSGCFQDDHIYFLRVTKVKSEDKTTVVETISEEISLTRSEDSKSEENQGNKSTWKGTHKIRTFLETPDDSVDESGNGLSEVPNEGGGINAAIEALDGDVEAQDQEVTDANADMQDLDTYVIFDATLVLQDQP